LTAGVKLAPMAYNDLAPGSVRYLLVAGDFCCAIYWYWIIDGRSGFNEVKGRI
jgi:hypothetical protein